VNIFRDFQRGDVLMVHLSDGTTVAGTFLRLSKNFLQLTGGKIEAAGMLHEMRSERLLVPRGVIRLVESSDQ
jgi:hypothetical protein